MASLIPKRCSASSRVPDMPVLFHTTNTEAAAAILGSGFRDREGSYGTALHVKGVWLSDQPLDANEGAQGDAILEVHFDIPLSGLDEWEWIEEGKTFREWCIPAAVVNKLATVAWRR